MFIWEMDKYTARVLWVMGVYLESVPENERVHIFQLKGV